MPSLSASDKPKDTKKPRPARAAPAGFIPQDVTGGDFGRHTTNYGKIVYRKLKKNMTEKDALRILRAVFKEKIQDIEKEKAESFWIKLLRMLIDNSIGKFISVLDMLPEKLWPTVDSPLEKKPWGLGEAFVEMVIYFAKQLEKYFLSKGMKITPFEDEMKRRYGGVNVSESKKTPSKEGETSKIDEGV